MNKKWFSISNDSLLRQKKNNQIQKKESRNQEWAATTSTRWNLDQIRSTSHQSSFEIDQKIIKKTIENSVDSRDLNERTRNSWSSLLFHFFFRCRRCWSVQFCVYCLFLFVCFFKRPLIEFFFVSHFRSSFFGLMALRLFSVFYFFLNIYIFF